MIDWVSIVRHSRRRFSNYAPNLRKLRPPKNPSRDKDRRNNQQPKHNNQHNNHDSAHNSPTESGEGQPNGLTCCYCHVWNQYFT